MTDLRVDDGVTSGFATAVAAYAGPVGAQCVATGPALGSGVVQDALGNVTLVLTVLDEALAAGAAGLARDARSTGQAWRSADTGLAMQAV